MTIYNKNLTTVYLCYNVGVYYASSSYNVFTAVEINMYISEVPKRLRIYMYREQNIILYNYTVFC
jgi:hypothetical protein